VNNLPKVVVQQRRDRDSNLRPLDRKSDALPFIGDCGVKVQWGECICVLQCWFICSLTWVIKYKWPYNALTNRCGYKLWTVCFVVKVMFCH